MLIVITMTTPTYTQTRRWGCAHLCDPPPPLPCPHQLVRIIINITTTASSSSSSTLSPTTTKQQEPPLLITVSINIIIITPRTRVEAEPDHHGQPLGAVVVGRVARDEKQQVKQRPQRALPAALGGWRGGGSGGGGGGGGGGGRLRRRVGPVWRVRWVGEGDCGVFQLRDQRA